MKEFLFIFTDYLKGNPTYPAIRRGLNFILNTSISAYFYEKIIGTYNWIEISDYKSLMDFLVKGHFIIPLSFYLLIYTFLGVTIFLLFNFRLDNKKYKAIKKIDAKEPDNERFDEILEGLSKLGSKFNVFTFSKEDIITFYKNNIANVSQNDINELKKVIHVQKSNLSNHYGLVFRFLIAICIYYFNLKNFPFGLFLTILFVLFISIFLIIKAFRLLDILPAVHRFLNRQVDEFSKVNQSI
jgi:hypothetical protein